MARKDDSNNAAIYNSLTKFILAETYIIKMKCDTKSS